MKGVKEGKKEKQKETTKMVRWASGKSGVMEAKRKE